MRLPPSIFLRTAYCLVLLAAVLPVGIAETSWLGLVVGGVGLGLVPSFAPMIFMAVAAFRIFQIVRSSRALEAPRATGLVRILRWLGLLLLYGGALSAVVTWVVQPLMHWWVPTRTDSGVEFFMEFYLYMVGGVGLAGLGLFEFSRLLSFERQARLEVTSVSS